MTDKFSFFTTDVAKNLYYFISHNVEISDLFLKTFQSLANELEYLHVEIDELKDEVNKLKEKGVKK